MATSDVRKLTGGINQRGLRDHNERLLLSMIQRHGALPGSDIARHAGLSPQTVSVILRGLENDGLIARGDPKRGKVGKPSIPMTLAADAVFSVGLKIGRRSADLMLVDFTGKIRHRIQITYPYPTPAPIFDFVENGLQALRGDLTQDERKRITGIGLAVPYRIWDWHETIGAAADDLAAWKDIDFRAEIAAFSDLPVFIENDATAACRAEHVFGRGRQFQDYAYFFVGSFIGGGVVINHSVFEGRQGNAGAFGSLPVCGDDGKTRQLIDTASVHLLERALSDAGIDAARLWQQPQTWTGFDAVLDPWVAATAEQIARAALSVCSVIDFEAVLIDGGFPEPVRHRLVAETARAIRALDSRGVVLPEIAEGTIGTDARALGAAGGPIFSQYFLNTSFGSAQMAAPPKAG